MTGNAHMPSMPSAGPALGAFAASGSSADRSLRVLALLAQEGRPLSLAEIAARVDLPKGTAHRICLQLVETRFLARDVGDRVFAVGPALRDLAFSTLNHGVARGLRHAVLADLVAEVGETCNFTTQDGTEVLYLDRVEAKWPLRLTLDVGSHVPIHCTASGKLFLAGMPAARRDEVIDAITLTKMTRSTITSKRALRAECEAIAACGYACDREEFIAGLIAVAVPVAAPASTARAAIAVHGPTARLSLEQAIEKLPALRSATVRMAALF